MVHLPFLGALQTAISSIANLQELAECDMVLVEKADAT